MPLCSSPEQGDPATTFAGHLERDRLAELEVRPAIEGRELLTLNLDLDGHDRSFGAAMNLEAFLAVAADPADPCVGEHRDVKTGGLLGGFAVEPTDKA